MSNDTTVNNLLRPTRSLSLKDAAKALVDARNEHAKTDAEIEAGMSALDTVAKTPTGRETKAVKLAKEALLEKRSKSYYACRRVESDFNHVLADAMLAFNRSNGCKFVVDTVLAKIGYTPIEDAGWRAELIATSDAVREADKSKPGCRGYRGEHTDYRQTVFMSDADVVYHSAEHGCYAVIRFMDGYTAYEVRYFGWAPVRGSLGLHFSYDDTTCIGWDDYDVVTDGRINIGSVGDLSEDECLERLNTFTLFINFCRHLSRHAALINREQCLRGSVHDGGVLEDLAMGKPVSVYNSTKHRANVFGRAETNRTTTLVPSNALSDLHSDAVHAGVITADHVAEISCGDTECDE